MIDIKANFHPRNKHKGRYPLEELCVSLPALNDIVVGANCIYPIIGEAEYGWSFVGSDIDPIALKAAEAIIKNNETLKNKVKLRLQTQAQDIFKGIVEPNERFEISICNPPFHASMAEAKAGTLRKLSNLKQQKVSKVKLNFGGQSLELCCKGGEAQFVKTMILQSKAYANSCLWFSTLVSKSEHLESIYHTLEKVGVDTVKTIPMSTGNKITRIVAWTFLNKEQQKSWVSAWK